MFYLSITKPRKQNFLNELILLPFWGNKAFALCVLGMATRTPSGGGRECLLLIIHYIIMSMYIGNLNYRVREGDLKDVFANYGNIVSVKIVKDHETGKSKGFAFVEMENPMCEYRVIHMLIGAELMGRQMIVREARMR